METFLTVVHVLLAVFMILVILLQPGKDAGMGAAFGGGASTSAFGGRGAVTFLSKLTAACAITFFITSLSLSFVGMKQSVLAGATSPTPAGDTKPTDTKPTDTTATPPAPTGAAVPQPSATPTTPPAGVDVQAAPANVEDKAATPPAAPSGTEAVPARKLPQ